MLGKRFRILAAVHLFLIQDDKILLLRRFQTGYEDGNYSVVAGHLDGNEELTAAMAREAKEEAKIEINPSHLQVVGVMHRYFGDDEAINFFLTATCWEGSVANGEPHKCDDLAWYPLDHLPENMIPYVRKAIENYRQGAWFESFGWQ